MVRPDEFALWLIINNNNDQSKASQGISLKSKQCLMALLGYLSFSFSNVRVLELVPHVKSTLKASLLPFFV